MSDTMAAALMRRREFWTDEQWERIVHEAKSERTNRPWSDRFARYRANEAAVRLRRIAQVAESVRDLHSFHPLLTAPIPRAQATAHSPKEQA